VPGQSQADLQQAAGNQQDDWTSINQENQSNSAPGSIDSNQGLVESGNNNIDVERPQQETNVQSQLPVNPEPFVPQPGQVELPKNSQDSPFSNGEGGEMGRGRQPWIPSADIKAFDDIFNSVESTRAQELSSKGSTALINSTTVFISCIIYVFSMLLL